MTVGERIRACRLQSELSQQQLATIVGVTVNMVSRWENGVVPRLEHLESLRQEFKCSLDWLAGGRGESPLERDPRKAPAALGASPTEDLASGI